MSRVYKAAQTIPRVLADDYSHTLPELAISIMRATCIEKDLFRPTLLRYELVDHETSSVYRLLVVEFEAVVQP